MTVTHAMSAKWNAAKERRAAKARARWRKYEKEARRRERAELEERRRAHAWASVALPDSAPDLPEPPPYIGAPRITKDQQLAIAMRALDNPKEAIPA